MALQWLQSSRWRCVQTVMLAFAVVSVVWLYVGDEETKRKVGLGMTRFKTKSLDDSSSDGRNKNSTGMVTLEDKRPTTPIIKPTETVSAASKDNHEPKPTENVTIPEQASKPPTTVSIPAPSKAPMLRPLTELAKKQIANYRNGTGLIVNLHITHHGGTAFCHAIGHSPDAKGSTPIFACMGPKPPQVVPEGYPKKGPWVGANETARLARLVRREANFHMISWEYRRAPSISFMETNWEEPTILPIIVMRDPMSQMLAGDGNTNKLYPGLLEGKSNLSEWEDFAHWSQTDNFALRVLSGDGCCHGKNTERKHLEQAQAVIERFAIVIDIECLNESVVELGKLLNITPAPMKKGKHHTPVRDRIGYDEVYEYLREKNKLSIELYEWSKKRSLVDCSELPEDRRW